MRGTRRAVIALVWLLGTGAATAITIEGVRVVGSNVINGESAINPRQANAALSGRTTTTAVAPTSTLAVTTTATTEAPTTTTEAPTTVAVTAAATTPTTARPGPTTTRKKTVATSPPTAKPPTPTSPPPTSPPTATTPAPPPPTSPPTTPSPTTTIKISTTTSSPSQCTFQQTRQTEGGFVAVCFTAQKVSVLVSAPSDGWTEQQSASGSAILVIFTKGRHTIQVLAYWSGGPQWQITDSN